MIDEPAALASCLGHFAVSMDIVPFQCPQEFGKDGRYVLEELIGYGPRSWVYKAKDSLLSRDNVPAWVAIKIERERGTQGEAVTARRVNSDHVVRVQDAGVTPEGHAYTVMELVESREGDLSKAQLPWEPRRAARIIRELARGVQAAHTAGVIHCDIKPTNVLLTRDGRPKLADFNLAVDKPQSEGMIRGNIAFMAPEQLRGRPGALAPAADVFALGGLLYWLLTGKAPRESSSSVLPEELPAGTPGTLAAICLRAMMADKASRYQTAEALADDLARWLGHLPVEWTKPGRIARARLWGRRRPTLAASLVVVLLASIAAGIPWARSVAVEQRLQREALAKADAEINRLKAVARAPILIAARAIKSSQNPSRTVDVFPTINYVEWLTHQSIVLGEDGKTTGSELRAVFLQQYLDELKSKDQQRSLPYFAAEMALAQTQLLMRRHVEAAALVTEMEQRWYSKLDPRDLSRLQIELVRGLCDAAAIEDPEQRASLLQAAVDVYLERTGDTRVKNYADAVRKVYATSGELDSAAEKAALELPIAAPGK